MKIAFFASSQFAVPSLEAVSKSARDLIIITQPDRPKGRGQKLAPTPVREAASRLGLKTLAPEKLSTELLRDLADFSPDVLATISYGNILTKRFLELPKIMPVNIHASLLPKYRGAAPINWAIINGETETGVTAIRMSEKCDCGDIILKKAIQIEDIDDAETLNQKLSNLAAAALMETLKKLEKGGELALIRQDEKNATSAPKLTKEDGLINWSSSPLKIHNMVRGFLPWPSAYTYYGKKLLKILKTSLAIEESESAFAPGEVVDVDKENGIIVSANQGTIRLLKVKMEGSSEMPAYDFAIGHRIKSGERFGV